MGDDEPALLGLWREKRGEIEPRDLSNVLKVQLGTVTEDLNRRWYERHSGCTVEGVQGHVRHPVLKCIGTTLDGTVKPSGGCSRPSSCCHGPFRRKPQSPSIWPSSHNMWVANARSAAVDHHGGRQMGEMTIPADPLYQRHLLTAEKKF
jgi:YqaJ-like viral recombinase domain